MKTKNNYLSVGSGPLLVDDGRLEVDEDGSRDVLAGTGLGEEGGEGVVPAVQLVRWHVAVRLRNQKVFISQILSF